MNQKKQRTAITPTRDDNYAEWYQQVIKASGLAEHSPVRGCMVIKPWGYAIWERIQRWLDDDFKRHDVENIYCPLLIPKSYLEKEAEQVEGFATECAVVTHHRLERQDDGTLTPAGELEEPFVIRPTSETIIGEMTSRWIQSYRDLPMKLNQWANVMRWEMRTRLFLRTSEFLWQEGHSVHAKASEAKENATTMLESYRQLAEDVLAIPVTLGEKSMNERFPGAVHTYTIEAMMQDGKALQSGTSHFLGQSFSKAFDVDFLNQTGEREHAWTSSWGASTRLIGGLIMTHSDDNGLVLPPKIAPKQIVILPIPHKSENPQAILDYCNELKKACAEVIFDGERVRVTVDNSEARPGDKAWSWIKKGVPIRLEIGTKEFDNQAVFVGRRDLEPRDKSAMNKETFLAGLSDMLASIQKNLLNKAKAYKQANTVRANTADELREFFKSNSGFVEAFWHDDSANNDIEQQLKTDHKITVRCLPLNGEEGTCVFSGKPGKLAVFAKAY